MNRPEVKIIQNQEENTQPANIASWEAEQLLRKYGYQPEQMSSITQNQPAEQPGLTFEEMVAQEEAKRRNEEEKRRQQIYGPKPTTFDGRNGYDSEVKYSSDDSGFSFKIEITSDMKIPKY